MKFLFDRHQSYGNLKYTIGGAIAAIGRSKPMSAAGVDKQVDDILNLRRTEFFCSQFVVMAYQLAAAQMGMSPKSVFALDDSKMPPARLATCCEQSVAFENIGYMSPNER